MHQRIANKAQFHRSLTSFILPYPLKLVVKRVGSFLLPYHLKVILKRVSRNWSNPLIHTNKKQPIPQRNNLYREKKYMLVIFCFRRYCQRILECNFRALLLHGKAPHHINSHIKFYKSIYVLLNQP